jgi:hypothetical protein
MKMNHHKHPHNATQLAKNGFRLIPVKKNGKVALVKNWPNQASSDPEKIAEWAGEYPGCNWGIVTDGLLIVDIDKRDDGNGFEHLEKISRATGDVWEQAGIVITPSGGEHRYFLLTNEQKQDPRIKSRNDVLGNNSHVDVKTGKAYVVAPSSMINGKSYEGNLPPKNELPEAPGGLIDMLFSSKGATQSNHGGLVTTDEKAGPDVLSQNGKSRWKMLCFCKKYGIVDPEDYDHWLKVTMALAVDVKENHLNENEAWAILDEWSKNTKDEQACHNYNYEENHKKFTGLVLDASPRNEKISFGTIHYMIEEWIMNKAPAGKVVNILRENFDGKPVTRKLALRAINRDWVFVRHDANNKPFRNLGDGNGYSKNGFINLLEPLKIRVDDKKIVPAAKAWISWNERKEVDEVRFMPGESSMFETDGKLFLNTFMGLDVERHPPVSDPEKKASVLLDHVLLKVCRSDEKIYNETIRLLAWWVQNPDKPGQRCIVLRGGQGTGKSMVGRMIQKLFSPYALQTGNTKTLTGDFNGHLENCLFLQADEAFFAGSNDVRRKLKALITDETMTYEKKGQDAHVGRNFVRIVMTTNERWAVHADDDDRRFVVLDIAPREQDDDEYFSRLHNAIEDPEKISALFQYLKAIKLESWHPMQMKCETKAYIEQKIASLDPIMAHIHTCLEEGRLPLKASMHYYNHNDDDSNHWPNDKNLEIRGSAREIFTNEINNISPSDNFSISKVT